MRSAMDSALKRSRSNLGLLLSITAALSPVGCAQLQDFRQSDRPLLGTLGLGQSKPADSTNRPVDQYAQSLKKPKPDDTMLADRGSRTRTPGVSVASVENDRGLNPRGVAPKPEDTSQGPVVLQAPVSIDDAPVLAANTTARVDGWHAKDAPVADDSQPVSATAAPTTPPESPPAANPLDSVLTGSRAKLDSLATYQVEITRQERVGDKLLPVEDFRLSIRRDPKAVRLEWPTGAHKGREVIYSATENGGLMQINSADSLIPVPRLSLPPDSPLVMSNSRHPITEAGFDTILHNLESAVQLEKGGNASRGKVSYGGLEQAEGLDHPCHKLVRVTPSGETWLVYIDPQTQIPALVQANAPDGQLLERYVFRDPKVNVPELAQADAFDANRRWGEPKGLLSRLSRGAGNGTKDAADTTTR